MTGLILKRASASRPSGECNEDDFDVLADGIVVGRIFKANASPTGASWMWTLDFWHNEDRTPTHGYEATREAAMARVSDFRNHSANARRGWSPCLSGPPPGGRLLLPFRALFRALQ